MTPVDESPGTHAILFSLELRPLLLAILAGRPQMYKCGLGTHCLHSHPRDGRSVVRGYGLSLCRSRGQKGSSSWESSGACMGFQR
jgi:hypothetical protein